MKKKKKKTATRNDDYNNNIIIIRRRARVCYVRTTTVDCCRLRSGPVRGRRRRPLPRWWWPVGEMRDGTGERDGRRGGKSGARGGRDRRRPRLGGETGPGNEAAHWPAVRGPPARAVFTFGPSPSLTP